MTVFFFITTLALASTYRAQAQGAPAAADGSTAATTSFLAPPPSVLSIALPPNARLRIDVDARDEDILGVVKSFLRGFNGQSLKELLKNTAPVTAAIGDDAVEVKPPAAPTDSGPAPTEAAPESAAPAATPSVSIPPAVSPVMDKAVLQLLSDANLQSIMRDINHLRVVCFQMPPAPYGTKQTAAARSVIAYYEQKYIDGEGGRRITRADMDETQLSVVSFPQRGFGIVATGPGFGVVVRADGYPNLESIGPLAMAGFLRFAPLLH
jgi:hypothetical protein